MEIADLILTVVLGGVAVFLGWKGKQLGKQANGIPYIIQKQEQEKFEKDLFDVYTYWFVHLREQAIKVEKLRKQVIMFANERKIWEQALNNPNLTPPHRQMFEKMFQDNKKLSNEYEIWIKFGQDKLKLFEFQLLKCWEIVQRHWQNNPQNHQKPLKEFHDDQENKVLMQDDAVVTTN